MNKRLTKRLFGEKDDTIWDKITDFFDDIRIWFKVRYEMICRMFYYGWNMRWAYDYDSGYVYKAVHLQMSRVLKFMMSDRTHLMWNYDKNSKGMRKLKTFVKLCERLNSDNYLHEALIPHKRIWGKSKCFFDPCPRSNCSTMRFMYENAKNEKEQKFARDQFHRYAKKGDMARKNDLDLFLKIWYNNLSSFWD